MNSKIVLSWCLLVTGALCNQQLMAAAAPDPRNPIQSRVLSRYAGMIHSVVFSPDGAKIIVGSDGSSYVLNTETGEPLCSLIRSKVVQSVAISADGTKIATGEGDGTVSIFDARADKPSCIRTLHCYDSCNVTALAFSEDGTKLAVGSFGQGADIWNVETGEKTHNFLSSEIVGSLAFSPNGTKLAIGSLIGGVSILNVETGSITKLIQLGFSVAFSPDGTKLAVGSKGGKVYVFDAQHWSLLCELMSDGIFVPSVTFSPDGTKLAAASTGKAYGPTSGGSGKLLIWDVGTNVLLHSLTGCYEGEILSVAFSPDGSKIVTGSRDRKVCVWYDTREKQKCVTRQVATALACAMHPRLGEDSPAQLIDPYVLREICNLTCGSFGPIEEQPGMLARVGQTVSGCVIS